jgi:hypothetical protein
MPADRRHTCLRCPDYGAEATVVTYAEDPAGRDFGPPSQEPDFKYGNILEIRSRSGLVPPGLGSCDFRNRGSRVPLRTCPGPNTASPTHSEGGYSERRNFVWSRLLRLPNVEVSFVEMDLAGWSLLVCPACVSLLA